MSTSPAAEIITESMTINEGDVYGALEVHDGAQGQTTVRTNGGRVEDILALDSSRIEVNGGELVDLTLRDQSSSLVQGGALIILGLSNDAHLGMSGGSVFLVFDIADNAWAHVTGGAIQSGAGLRGNANLEIAGGQWEGLLYSTEYSTLTLRNLRTVDGIGLWATDQSRVNLFASETQYDPGALTLSGTWLDGQAFSIQLHDAETFNHVTIIPEPSMLASMILVAVLGNWRRRRAQATRIR